MKFKNFMKKTFFILFAAIFLLTGCEKKEEKKSLQDFTTKKGKFFDESIKGKSYYSIIQAKTYEIRFPKNWTKLSSSDSKLSFDKDILIGNTDKKTEVAVFTEFINNNFELDCNRLSKENLSTEESRLKNYEKAKLNGEEICYIEGENFFQIITKNDLDGMVYLLLGKFENKNDKKEVLEILGTFRNIEQSDLTTETKILENFKSIKTSFFELKFPENWQQYFSGGEYATKVGGTEKNWVYVTMINLSKPFECKNIPDEIAQNTKSIGKKGTGISVNGLTGCKILTKNKRQYILIDQKSGKSFAITANFEDIANARLAKQMMGSFKVSS